MSSWPIVVAGADPTGVTDSTTAIQAAITQAAKVGAMVQLPPGIFKTSGLVIPDKVVGIAGMGSPLSNQQSGATGTILKSTTNAPILTFTATTGIVTQVTLTSRDVVVANSSIFAIGQKVVIPSGTGLGNGPITFGSGAGETATPEIATITPASNTLTMLLGQDANSALSGSNLLIRRADYPNRYCSVENLLLLGNGASNTVSTWNGSSPWTSITLTSAPTGLQVGQSMTIVGAGETRDGILYDHECIVTSISGSTVTFTPSTTNNPASAAVRAQHGLVVDNFGLLCRNVLAYGCGGHGFAIRTSVGAQFHTCKSSNNSLDGWNIDGTMGLKFAGATSNNSWFGCSAADNRDGVRMVSNGWGQLFYGFTNEKNTGYGFLMLGGKFDESGDQGTNFCRINGVWDEKNGRSVFLAANAKCNVLDFVRMESTNPPSDTGVGNMIHGSPIDSQVWGDQTSPGHKYNTVGLTNLCLNVSRQTVGSGGLSNPTFDFSGAASSNGGNGGICEILLNGNVTGTVTWQGQRDGYLLHLVVIQGSAAKTWTWPTSGIMWENNSSPSVTGLAANHRCLVSLYYNATDNVWYELYRRADMY